LRDRIDGPDRGADDRDYGNCDDQQHDESAGTDHQTTSLG
jgi:hypothetical protein